MDEFLWMIMPLGPSHGWGVCGRYLTIEMDRLVPVRLITEDLECEAKNNPLHYKRLTNLRVSQKSIPLSPGSNGSVLLHGPVIQAIGGPSLRPWFMQAEAPKRVGYTFFEKTRLRKEDTEWARGYFDQVVAGSAWCESILRSHGMTSVSTIIQGIDTAQFHPAYAEKKSYRDHFVVFSGGKLELRKGQDIVLRAFKAMQDKYDDVLLVNNWHNRWDNSVMTMQMSPHITFNMPKGDYFRAIKKLLTANGIDPEKVVTLPPIPHAKMAEIYRDTDCGLFPNRCEGGTNLVLMEYMACGKPAIASFSTGHMDVINEENSIPLRSMGKLRIQDGTGKVLEEWDDPNLDEVIAKLEWTYHNRTAIKDIGRKAGESMQHLTWERAARAFLELI